MIVEPAVSDLRTLTVAEQRLFDDMSAAFGAYQNASAEEKEAARERYAVLLEQFSQMILPNRES